MAGPLKLDSTNLKEMTVGEQDYISHVILTDFASSDTGIGTVQINPADTTGLTIIGSFIDTKRTEAVGTHPASGSTTTVSTYTFYQDRQTATESITARPVEWTGSDIKEQTDAVVDPLWINSTQDKLAAFGIGSYKLQPSAPGGTWANKGTITNTDVGGASNSSTLWRNTSGSAPTTVRPIKYTTGVLQEMTDAEIEQWTPRFRNKVKDGIGQYVLATSAPGSGSWTAAGSAFFDTRKQMSSVNYSGDYSGTYTGTYAGNYTGTYTGTYANNFALFYNGRAGNWYTGYFSGNYSGTYTGYYTGSYTGTYTGTYAGQTIQSSNENVTNMTLWVRTA